MSIKAISQLLESRPKFKNKKKGTEYIYLGDCINCTNSQDGQLMCLYTDGELIFVREKEEFMQKFIKVNIS